jgi:hypothetical protein
VSVQHRPPMRCRAPNRRQLDVIVVLEAHRVRPVSPVMITRSLDTHGCAPWQATMSRTAGAPWLPPSVPVLWISTGTGVLQAHWPPPGLITGGVAATSARLMSQAGGRPLGRNEHRTCAGTVTPPPPRRLYACRHRTVERRLAQRGPWRSPPLPGVGWAGFKSPGSRGVREARLVEEGLILSAGPLLPPCRHVALVV